MKFHTFSASLIAVSLAIASATDSLVAPLAHSHTSMGEMQLWLPPLEEPLRVSQPFDLPHGVYRAGHRGIDLPASTGAPVRAPTSGTVSFAGTVVDRPLLSLRTSAGTVLSLEPVDSTLTAGATVTKGQRIGVVATGGHCATSCLHLGVRVNGAYVNPLQFLRERPVLLPW